MTNLEFYKEEIITNTTENFKRWIPSTSIGEELIECYKRRGLNTDHTLQGLINWLCEEHQILDKEEKEYLSNVIRPFRGSISYIAKRNYYKNELLVIRIYSKLRLNFDYENVELPLFEKGTMYKGMEPDKEYTLEELGL